ncbi:MAG: OsmC family protein [Rhodocyclaceae bacterium]|nr:OsmC family protein [Rhodocyclaceae bacterium]
MVTASMHGKPYQTVVSNGSKAIVVDTRKDGVGGYTGFKPHELLEGALAACTNLTIRITAEKLGIPIAGLNTVAELDSSNPDHTAFLLQIDIVGDLSEAQRDRLLQSIRLCPVSKMLSAPISITWSAT